MAKRIAVIDDDPDFLGLMQMLLQGEGYEVEGCSEGSKAYEFIRNWKPGLVYLDIRMAGETGWEILDELKKDPSTRDIVVIVTSAATIEIKAAEPELRAKGCDILLKPFDIDEVLSKTRQYVGNP
ncbi:MAG: response regulator [Chloroflexi bacterium]|nr:response regulator [Chloroflexota bacterium]